MTRALTDEDREFIRAELQSAGMAPVPSPAERHAEEASLVGKLTARRGRRTEPLPEHMLLAKGCRCENPQTYTDEDGDRRCLCGRAA